MRSQVESISEKIWLKADRFSAVLFRVDIIDEAFLHYGVQPACGLIQHQHLGIVHKGGNHGKLALDSPDSCALFPA